MPHVSSFRRRCDLAAIVTVIALCVLLAPRVSHADTRHHITFGLGYTKLLSDDLKDETLGIDFTNAFNGLLTYRYSLNSSIDLCLDSRGMISTDTALGVDLTMTNSYFGPGVRWNMAGMGPRLFLQGSLLFANEEFDAEQGGVKISGSDSSVGFGAIGGVDIPMSKLLSLPIELHYIYAKPADDVSGFGANVGLAFNWGAM